ncbi:MAG: hypothetical protein RI973_932 [Bacteroidota bacterium]|jgi:tetratricopeptide (TPR) repeat protein
MQKNVRHWHPINTDAMDMNQLVERHQNLEQFRHLLFHLQMECGSIHQIFRFFRETENFQHFDALKEIDPGLMPQLLAREYVLEARKAPTREEAREHLGKALQLDPLCPEACLELAVLSETAEGAMAWYQKCMDVTLVLLGPERMAGLLEEFRQKPWKQVETISFFKAKVGLAETLFRNGYYETARLHFQELLELNPADDLQIRPYLVTCLLCESQLEMADSELRKEKNNIVACAFEKAFLKFRQQGDSRQARRALQIAFRRNPWVAVYLMGLEKMPPARLLAWRKSEKALRPGSRLEAADCVRCIAPAFIQSSTLQYWMWEMLKDIAFQA